MKRVTLLLALAIAAAMPAVRAAGQPGPARPARLAVEAVAPDAPPVPLWPAGAPGALGSAAEDRPSVTPYLPDAGRATGAAMLVFPGGGYQHLALDHEGAQIARWLNSLGVAAFVVRYRLGPRYHHPAMEQDALRAVRLVRARAAEWRVDARRVGVIGFSAGGHMAATAATRFGSAPAAASDAVDRESARPDVAVLAYPVVTMADPLAHKGSRTNLLGDAPNPELVRALSLETQVTRDTPPTFLVATTDDAVVPVENSLLFYRALHAAGVPVELHVFESGHHGFGLAPGDAVLSGWVPQCAAWLGRHGFLRAAAAPAAGAR